MSLCRSGRTPREHRNLRNSFDTRKVSGEATEALEHASFDACDRLKQPPARRQVAVAHPDFFNDAVLSGCELSEAEGRPQQRKEDDDSPEHRGCSIGNAHNIPNTNSDIAHVVENLRAWLASVNGAPKCPRVDPFVHRSVGNSWTKPNDGESVWTRFLVRPSCTWSKLRTHARCLWEMDINGADVQTVTWVLGEKTGLSDQHRGVPGHVLEDNTAPALLEREGQFRKQAQYRYKMSDGSDRGESQHKD